MQSHHDYLDFAPALVTRLLENRSMVRLVQMGRQQVIVARLAVAVSASANTNRSESLSRDVHAFAASFRAVKRILPVMRLWVATEDEPRTRSNCQPS
jgi:hypothetical protein